MKWLWMQTSIQNQKYPNNVQINITSVELFNNFSPVNHTKTTL